MHTTTALERLEQLYLTIRTHLPHLTKPQAYTLALYSFGIVATSTCGLTTLATCLALLLNQPFNTVRQRLREYYKDASHKKGTHRRELDPATCFAPLMRWITHLWSDTRLILALDATTLGQRFTALTVSVLYRGRALPVAWKILPATQQGSWRPHWEALLRALQGSIPASWTVLVCADRGLYAPWLFELITALGWHPFLRINAQGQYHLENDPTVRELATVAPCAGTHWCGRVVCFKANPLPCTLLACWEVGHKEAWLIVTDLSPEEACVAWYAKRAWIESGFSDLKRRGWQWHRTQMQDGARAARVWLALAIATLWVMSVGGSVDEARLGARGKVSCFRLGRLALWAQWLSGDAGAWGMLSDWERSSRAPPRRGK
ncbi:MAG: transposase [Fimbriimonadales bacterium]|nr:MAG: hypothetical protein KatS3mg018_0407 [Fimbriimonadales bacterium]BCW95305.1 MAG: hypothetical protein KatS3mg018_0787 [Fimbriimonadales bacterium]